MGIAGCDWRILSHSLQVRPPSQSLTQCKLQDIRFLYSFQENLESVGVRDQVRFVEVSTTAVTRAMVKSVSTRCPISKNEAIRLNAVVRAAKSWPNSNPPMSDVISLKLYRDWTGPWLVCVRILPYCCIITSWSSEPYSSARAGCCASKSSIVGIGLWRFASGGSEWGAWRLFFLSSQFCLRTVRTLTNLAQVFPNVTFVRYTNRTIRE